MYLPRWFVYLGLAITGLVLGWFAQGTALAVPAPTVLTQRLADSTPSVAPSAAAVPTSSTSSPAAHAAMGEAVEVPTSNGPAPVGSTESVDPGSDQPRPAGDTEHSPTPRQLLATTTRPTSSDDEQEDATEIFDIPWYHLLNPLVLFGANRTVDIAGFEDHSINVAGTGQFVVYDDSNLFVNRTGKLNANTGDTDSAGLNAIDTIDSEVSSGPHCDDGCDDESIISAEHGHFDEGDSDDDDDDDDDDEDDDERIGAFLLATNTQDGQRDPRDPRETRDEADTGEEPTRPIDPGGIEIGGDGWDDLAVRLTGRDNVIVYDDSNVVFGGVGDVNAQIGDSDTGGTVTMHTVRSIVRGGVSR